MERGRNVLRYLRRLRIREGIRHRTQVARNTPRAHGANLDKPGTDVYRAACAGLAAVVLKIFFDRIYGINMIFLNCQDAKDAKRRDFNRVRGVVFNLVHPVNPV